MPLHKHVWKSRGTQSICLRMKLIRQVFAALRGFSISREALISTRCALEFQKGSWLPLATTSCSPWQPRAYACWPLSLSTKGDGKWRRRRRYGNAKEGMSGRREKRVEIAVSRLQHGSHGLPFGAHAYGALWFRFYTTRTLSVQPELCLLIIDAAASTNSLAMVYHIDTYTPQLYVSTKLPAMLNRHGCQVSGTRARDISRGLYCRQL